jgi:Leucine-rich repeat (LRR) protein
MGFQLIGMSEKELYHRLLMAYSDQNLNRITANLIQIYKSKHYELIRDISASISEFIHIDTEKINKCFSKLVMLYHPDKGPNYRNEIERNYLAGDQKKQHQLSHILLIEFINELSNEDMIPDDIDYTPEYGWEEDLDGFTYFTDRDVEIMDDYRFTTEEKKRKVSFMDAFKRKVYGNVDIEFYPHHLENIEDIELADYEITSLEGMEFCRNVKRLDLSGNNITELSKLWTLTKLEEIFLADNKISNIDALRNLKRLKVIDLSNNLIKDISPLFFPDQPEYINLSGNEVLPDMLNKLKREGCIILVDS